MQLHAEESHITQCKYCNEFIDVFYENVNLRLCVCVCLCVFMRDIDERALHVYAVHLGRLSCSMCKDTALLVPFYLKD